MSWLWAPHTEGVFPQGSENWDCHSTALIPKLPGCQDNSIKLYQNTLTVNMVTGAFLEIRSKTIITGWALEEACLVRCSFINGEARTIIREVGCRAVITLVGG